jgi:hypothetical protein
MKRLIPYNIDNVRLQYLPTKTSRGYATGLDLKLNGEFIRGTESWVSLSLLNTRENINHQGYTRRPTDQLVNIGIFFQDFLPWNNTIKFNITGFYGSNIPSNPPFTRRDITTTIVIPAYKRVDFGLSKQILSEERARRKNLLFKNIWVGVELLNAFDTFNTASYMWIKDVEKHDYAIPNYLTGRTFNVKLSVKI